MVGAVHPALALQGPDQERFGLLGPAPVSVEFAEVTHDLEGCGEIPAPRVRV